MLTIAAPIGRSQRSAVHWSALWRYTTINRSRASHYISWRTSCSWAGLLVDTAWLLLNQWDGWGMHALMTTKRRVWTQCAGWDIWYFKTCVINTHPHSTHTSPVPSPHTHTSPHSRHTHTDIHTHTTRTHHPPLPHTHTSLQRPPTSTVHSDQSQ